MTRGDEAKRTTRHSFDGYSGATIVGQQPQEGQMAPGTMRSPAARYFASGRPRWLSKPSDDLVRRHAAFTKPEDIDWGKRWEQRRETLIENTFGNKYFIFCAFLLLLFYTALLAIGWIAWDHKKDIGYFETELVKARNWATYWKGRAIEAITRHNEHIEKCNRVIEAGETGIPVGDAAEAIDLRHELERTRAELRT